ncbi:tetratricopeptide repeat protein [Novosphingobium mangrovi (ex Hu et al. 2023)]|uniref:Tetratricopeptide repeat protein n=1 Tax=Novosphingobium mangrovi (ex Hu et al. 2023) TaxID=2930094 RepID=A0ABT0AA06_9SPHN|nr:tetratricopeptide repeat protein [Novosphingobium mangrovi (ex Hu et al. 2023)]MCJ1959984.1 tetratricopeptide repeat protein [Novosphingobium mangrovi (ex Hu et al. 2023)]
MKRVLPSALVPALALALALSLAGCGLDPAEQMERARASYAAHDFTRARLDLVSLLQEEPQNEAARKLLVRTLLAMGDGEGARQALERIAPGQRSADHAVLLGEAALLRERPDEALGLVDGARGSGAQWVRGMAHLLEGDPAKARSAFARGLEEGPEDARLLADFARLELKEGHVPEARGLVDRALKVDPASREALLADGQVATAQGDLLRALEAYSAALEAYPGNLAALTGKAAILGDLGRTEDMQAVLDAVPEGTGASPELVYLRARLAGAQGDWAKVRGILQSRSEVVRTRDEAAILYARALVELDQDEQARAALQPVLTRTPSNVAARRELARIQIAQKDFAGALATLEPLVAKSTASASDRRLYAEAAKGAGRGDAAQAAQRARAPSPQALAAQLAEADTAMKAGNWANASALYKSLLAVTDGTNPLFLNNLALAESRLGRRQEGVAFALRALESAPENASVMDTAGWLLVETESDHARGLRLLEAAAKKAPDNATIAGHLASARKGT